MIAHNVPSWEGFSDSIEELRSALTGDSRKPPELLFRGQSNSNWQLTTTLERAGCEGMTFDDYYRLAVTRVRPMVETFTGRTWDVPDYDTTLEHSFRTDVELLSLLKFPSLGLYRYMVYLRHHGFPSPLLDWTSSPNVAAFFAFREADTAKTRSIYVYCERPHGFKGGAVGEPSMRAIGEYVRAHARHFRQQSDYTICGAFDDRSGGWRFHRHDPVFWSHDKQDYLWKFNFPSTERPKVLKSLDGYNLNAFSLFDTEETLLETVWLREYVLEKGTPQMDLNSDLPLPLSDKSLATILREHGYESHPRGMAQPLGADVEQSSDGTSAYVDVNAEAVRKKR
jgi:hypothetical protein